MNTFAMLLGPPLLAALLAAAVKPYRRFVGWSECRAIPPLPEGGRGPVAPHPGGRCADLGAPRVPAGRRALDLACAVRERGGRAGRLARAGDGPGTTATTAPRPGGSASSATCSPSRCCSRVTSNNVGFMWIAIEATTISSAMLIPLHVTKASVEASWKYILIGSIGIALAFGGTVLGYFDFVNLAGRQEEALNWTVLMASASRASSAGDPARVRLHPHRIRHEGGPRADAHVAARMPIRRRRRRCPP